MEECKPAADSQVHSNCYHLQNSIVSCIRRTMGTAFLLYSTTEWGKAQQDSEGVVVQYLQRIVDPLCEPSPIDHTYKNFDNMLSTTLPTLTVQRINLYKNTTSNKNTKTKTYIDIVSINFSLVCLT